MNEIQKKIKQYGDQQQLQALQEYVKNIELEELTSFISEHICHRNSIQTWIYLLQGFTDNSDSHEKRSRLVLSVLHILDANDVPEAHAYAVVTRLRLELPKFKSNHLIEICDFCIDRIQNGNVVYTCWKDLLPEVLSIIVERDCVTYNETEISGAEFKKQIINTLCMITWTAHIVTPLAAMFRDVSLSKEEHLQVVNKLGQCMEKLPCQEIPGFTYQLLKLCSVQNSKCIFLRLQYYFSDRIYKNLGKDLEPSSDTTDLSDITDTSMLDVSQVESTVLYHIHNSAMLGHGSIKEYINSLKNMLRAPEFILHPFQFTVLLTISTVSIFEEQALEVIRACITRVITEECKKADSAWFTEMVTTSTKISNIISAIIENSLKERQLVVLGLINLGFILLGAGASLGNKNIAEAQWELGTFLLLKLMKKKREVASTVIQQLCDRIITGQNVAHLTDCLHQMCRSLTFTVLECQNIIIQLIEQILQISGTVARHIIDAIIPLIKVAHSIRDNLILILRKALYSRKVETRQMAVSGFLKLLKNLKISNLAALSQSSNSSTSSHSFLTQISLECQAQTSTSNKFSNEALCLEVLGILRRCFMQQAEVRAELYEGLYDAVCMNAELAIPVLDIIWIHFNQFYVTDEEAIPPLLFTDTLCSKNIDVIVQEPLGHLIFATGLIVTKVCETHDPSNPSIKRFTDILESICTRMGNCELVHFDLDDGTDLLDTLPACQIKLHILKQAMSVYDALMGYLISTWNPKSENTAQKINSLFQSYSRLLDFSKNLNKPKKAETRKKSKDDTFKKPLPAKSKIFKPLPNVMDFQTVGKILSFLYEPTVSWTNVAQTNILKVKREFHRYILNIILQLVLTLKTSKCAETIHTKPYFGYCTEIAVVLYERVIKRLEYVIDFDCTTAVLGAECFHALLSLIASCYKEKLPIFLSKVGSKDKDADLGEHLLPFIEVHQVFFQKEEVEYTDDPEGKKLPLLLMNSYTILVSNLPTTGQHTTTVLDWIKQYADTNVVSNKNVGNALISLLLNMHIRCKTSSGLFENVAIRLCDIIGTVNHDKLECTVELKIINEGTAGHTLSALVSCLKTMLDEADWLIQRFRAAYSMIIYPGSDKVERRKEILKNKERDLCCHLYQIINVCFLISNMAITQAAQIEAIFKILTHVYNTLSSLTKYFILQSSKLNPAFQSARFERVLKLAGKSLSNRVYEFITFIEESQHSSSETTQSKKKSPDPSTLKLKVLRETRLIPKLVYELEQFGKNIITLSNKTKIDLLKHVGIGTARDFRIKVPALKEALEKVGTTHPDDATADDENEGRHSENDEAMEVQSSASGDAGNTESSMDVDEQEEREKENGSDEDNDAPPKKKGKKSK